MALAQLTRREDGQFLRARREERVFGAAKS